MRITELFLIGCLVFCSDPGSRARAQPGIEQGPVPSWSELLPVPTPDERTEDEPVSSLLSDKQVHIERDRTFTLRHTAQLVRAPAGIDAVASIDVERGASDRITWHFIRRQRKGKSEELLPQAHSRVIQPESEREQGVLTGRVHELIVLQDIRVGDLLEMAYSVDSPQLSAAPRIALYEWLGRLTRVQRLAWRATWPNDRKLRFKADGVEITRVSDHELRYEREHSPAYTVDENMPAWFQPAPHVELTEYSDWDEVAQLMAKLYPAGAELPNHLVEPFKKIADPLLRMSAAVSFVQDEVRYLGIEDGEQAVTPHAPTDVLSRRYGDCKDKSYLLVTLLRALGFEAAPALVSSRWQRRVAAMLPSPAAFDHAIVFARLGDRDVWIDATQRFVRSTMAKPPSLPFGYALVLRAGETALRELPLAAHTDPDLVVVEHFNIQEGGRSRLLVKTWYQNEQALAMRERIAARSRQQLEHANQEFYARQFRGVRIAAPLSIVDSPNQEQVYTEEAYMLDKFWADGEQSIAAWSILERLPNVAPQRRTPLALPFPLHVQHRIELETDSWELWHEDSHVDSEFFACVVESTASSRHVHEVMFDLRFKTDSVLPGQLQSYAKDRQRMLDALQPGFISGRKNQQQQREQPENGLPRFGLIALGATVFAAACWYASRRATVRQRAFTRAKRPASGEEARTAIEVARAEDAELLLKKLRCCGEPLWSVMPPTVSSVSYAGAELQVYRLVCAKCGVPHRRYVRVTQ